MQGFLVVSLLLMTFVTEASRSIDSEAESWLRDGFEFIPCGKAHFIYGVGYIDGSYMERIFYTADSGDEPQLEIRFRDDSLIRAGSRQEVANAPFVMELRLGRAQHAIPAGPRWLVQEGWESALRFKYTSWFGNLSWSGNGWQVNWQGYRRPMLPGPLLDEPGKTCALFEPGG